MILSVNSSKSLAEIDTSLREAAQRHQFGILNVFDLKQRLGRKGIDLGRECRVYDICNPQAASTALNADISVSVCSAVSYLGLSEWADRDDGDSEADRPDESNRAERRE